METIKVSIDVNINLSQATQQFIATLFNQAPQPIQAAATNKVQAERTTSASVASAPSPAPQAERTAPAPVASTSAPVTPAASTEEEAITVEMLRALVSANANDHRDEMKAKLNEFEAKSVTVLDKKYYREMYSFLKSLK